MLSFKVTVSGTDYYLSNQEYISVTGNDYHLPFITRSPNLSLKKVRGGFITIELGNISIENRPQDSEHPFSGARYKTLIDTPQTYPFVLNFGESNYDFLTGTIALSKMDSDNLHFSIEADEYDFQLTSTVTDFNGNTVINPFSFGVVTHGTPVVQKTATTTAGITTFANPGLGNSGVTIYSNGSALNITSNDGTTITTDDYDEGEVSISGTSDNGTTLEDFFDYVANTIGLTTTTADTTKATNASSINITCYSNSTSQLLDYAGDVAEATNHQFYIGIDKDNASFPSTLFLIDRENSPTATALDDEAIIKNQIKYALPLKEVRTTYEYIRVANNLLERGRQNLVSSNNANGRTVRVLAFADTVAQRSDVQTLIDDVKAIEKKSIVAVEIPDIQVSYDLGDRFTYNFEEDFMTVDMIARAYYYDFDNETTTIEGEATLTVFTQS